MEELIRRKSMWKGIGRRKIWLMESNGKCRYLKNCPVKGLCGRCFICLRPPSLLWPHTRPYHSWALTSRPMPPASAFRILYLSPVPEHSDTGMGSLIPVLDWFRVGFFVHFGSRLTGCRTVLHSGLNKNIHPARQCTSTWQAMDWDTLCKLLCWWWKGVHPVRPYRWRWKRIQPASPYFWSGFRIRIRIRMDRH